MRPKPASCCSSRAAAPTPRAALTGAQVLLLGGEPIDEPIAGHGPIVMNRDAEIIQASEDFTAGHFGQMPG